MTDAERIAEILNHENWGPRVRTEDIERFADRGDCGVSARLLALLSDVRREEREVCVKTVADEAQRLDELASTGDMSESQRAKLLSKAVALEGAVLLLRNLETRGAE